MIRVSDYLTEFLVSRGVHQVYTLSGGMIMQFIDSFAQHGGIDIVTVHHEQAAAFAADAEGRILRRPAVALATSGPGAINLLTGVGSCFFDSVPALFITGQVNRAERRRDRRIRQLGFQETDIVSMAQPITKHARIVDTPEEFPAALEAAWSLACEGRPGPVLLDIPMDVTRSLIPEDKVRVPPSSPSHVVSAEENGFAARLVRSLRAGASPLILAGRGVLASGAKDDLLRLAERLDVPIVWSLLGIGVVPSRHPLSVGMIGTYGNRWANIALAKADPLLVIGSRLDIRQTGADTVAFKGDRHIFHVDVEPGEINNRVLNCDGLVGRAEPLIEAALDIAGRSSHIGWRSEIAALKARWPDTAELAGATGINPNVFIRALSRPDQPAVYVLDVGQHQMWAAQSLILGESQQVITSGGMGAMGFALPAAIGAAYATGRSIPVVCIAGDAGFQLNIQELETVRRNNLPVKIAVINNRCHGMTRQFQQTYFDGRYEGTVIGYSTPDFAAVGSAYGIHSIAVADESEIEGALERFWSNPLESVLLEIQVDYMTNVYPKLAFGRPVSEMEPFATPVAMEGT